MCRTGLYLGAVMLLISSTAAGAIEIDLDFNAGEGIDPVVAAQAEAGFEQAARIWERRFIDPITVNIEAGFESLDEGVLGQTGSNSATVAFSDIRSAMAADATSPAERMAVSNLSGGDRISFITNTVGTEDGVEAPVLDSVELGTTVSSTDNTVLNVNTANLKALGFNIAPDTTDANVTFNSEFNFDFNRRDGIEADAFDFVGIAAHEIGHALGFVSGVDTVDLLSGVGPLANQFIRNPLAEAGLDPNLFANINVLDALAQVQGQGFAIFSPLDLFRFSDLSLNSDGGFLGFDFTTDLGLEDPLTLNDFFGERLLNRTDLRFFSIDGGKTIWPHSPPGLSMGPYLFSRAMGLLPLCPGVRRAISLPISGRLNPSDSWIPISRPANWDSFAARI